MKRQILEKAISKAIKYHSFIHAQPNGARLHCVRDIRMGWLCSDILDSIIRATQKELDKK